ncbi:MAG: radical SAM protein [Pseudomonadota bacterium]
MNSVSNRIALVQPFTRDGNYIPNLGLLIISNVLEQAGYRIKIFDENLKKDILEDLVSFDPFMIGFTAVTAAINRVHETAQELKRDLPNTYIAVGGPHATLLPEEVLKNPAIDFCIVGEGEFPFLELVQALTQSKNVESIQNLVFKNDGKVVRNAVRPLLTSDELDQLPPPAFHLLDLKKIFPNIAHGLYSRGKRILPLMTSRGCPYSCTFCCRMMGKEVRKLNPERVLEEIDRLVNVFKVDEIYFEDDNFTVDRKRALFILNAIKERYPGLHLKFANGIRADRVDEEILKALLGAGGYWIGFGIESGSPNTLKKMKKSLDLETAKKNVALANKLGFKTGANMIIGYPDETWADIKQSLSFFLSLDLDSLAIVNLIPFPGTEVHKLCAEKGYLTKEASNYDNYFFGIFNIQTLIKTPSLSPMQLKLAVRYSYFKFYFLSGKRLPKFVRLALSRILIPKLTKRKR